MHDRGIYVFINKDGQLTHEFHGDVTQAEILGIEKYVEDMSLFATFEAQIRTARETLGAVKSLAEAVLRLTEEQAPPPEPAKPEGEQLCGKELPEEPSPSQD